MVDDHVDRPGVEVRQRMKLTGTNSSIGLIVPIASAHRINSTSFLSSRCRDLRSLRCGRRTSIATNRKAICADGDAPCACGLRPETHPTTCLKIQLLKTSCALPTWWLWRGGCTRSLSEHGRETPLRPWYFVSRRGRVGRCQVCQAQLQGNPNRDCPITIFSTHTR